MIYYCADDYGVSKESNSRIAECIENGILNKVSVLPNGDISGFKQQLADNNADVALHLNLVEGKPLSNPEDIGLLLAEDGCFRFSFIGLFLHSLLPKRKVLERQLYKEIKSQIEFWKTTLGEEAVLSIDGHQHTHMIPLVFKTLMRVISDEGINVNYIRVPAEPITPYLSVPSLYMSYNIVGLIKQWLLKVLAFVNRKELKKSKIPTAYFMGVLFSGRLTEEKIKKILPKYLKKAEKSGKDIEIAFHPGYVKNGEALIDGCRKGFRKFYFSPWRNAEYNTLLNLKF